MLVRPVFRYITLWLLEDKGHPGEQEHQSHFDSRSIKGLDTTGVSQQVKGEQVHNEAADL